MGRGVGKNRPGLLGGLLLMGVVGLLLRLLLRGGLSRLILLVLLLLLIQHLKLQLPFAEFLRVVRLLLIAAEGNVS